MTSSMSTRGERSVEKPDFVFYGKAGAGKTTCANYLTAKHGYSKLSFAAELKRIAVQLWGEEAFTDRGKLQALGSTLRKIDEDVWVNCFIREYEASDYGPVTNDDCRFPNEYWRLKERGFLFVRVMAPEEIRVDRLQRNGKLQDLDQLNHESETALLGLERVKEGIVPDFTIQNVGSVDTLEETVESIYIMAKEGV